MVWWYRVIEHTLSNEQGRPYCYYAIHEVSFNVSSDDIARADDVEQLLMTHLAGYAVPAMIHGPSLATIKEVLHAMEKALARPTLVHAQLDNQRQGYQVVHYDEWDTELQQHYLLYDLQHEAALQTWFVRPFDEYNWPDFGTVAHLFADDRNGLRWILDEMLGALGLPVLPASAFASNG